MAAVDPAIDRYVFLVDGFGENPGIQHAVVLHPSDVFDYEEYVGLAYSSDVTELSTAVKPFVLRYLLGIGYDRAFYFDPDIEIFASLDPVTRRLDDASVVLTPHTTEPIPLDGKQPDEIVLLQAGAYNLGFIGVAATADGRAMLDWWAERLKRYCVNDVAAGLFTDQKWIDLVPGIVDRVAIVNHRGCNVAYWNLHARRIDARDPRWLATGEPVIFFHYSGFDVRRPDRLSKHQTRIEVDHEPGLASLLRSYADRVSNNGFAACASIPYGYARFSNGVALDAFSRRLLRDARLGGLNFPDPGDVYAEPSAWRYLNGRADDDDDESGKPPLTRYLRAFWELRSDLRAAFPHGIDGERDGYLRWLRAGAAKVVDRAYLVEAGLFGGRPALAGQGVNVAGYFRTESGVGKAGRGHVRALNAAGVATRLIDVSDDAPSRNSDTMLDLRTHEILHAINLVCVNADRVATFLEQSGPEFFAGRYNIGSWWWELPEFPDRWRSAFAPFDEIWVGSQFVASTIASKSPVPIVMVPPVVDLGPVRSGCRQEFGLRDDEMLFLFMFDYRSVFERKNPLAVVEAFQRAFRDQAQRVRLVVKSINGDANPAERAALERAVHADGRITLIDGYLSKRRNNELLGACDAYVSLHRAEGFGYTLAEAMALAKPVIATNWSGPVDYLSVKNSFPIGFELVRLAESHGPYDAGQTWAEPDLEAAVHAMRAIWQEPRRAASLGARARADVLSRYSPTAVARVIAARLEHVSCLRSNLVPA